LFEDSKDRMLRSFCGQAEALLARCGDRMSPAHRRAVAVFAGVWKLSRWKRFVRLRRHGLVMNGYLRNLALFVVLIRGKRSAPTSEQV
jgi:hypothetical protein